MNHEKSRNHLRAESTKPDSLAPGLQGARLKVDQYRGLLKLWVANGTQPHDTEAVKNWRQQFVKKLSDPSYGWRELIQCDVKRLDETSRQSIKDRLSEAQGDPLLFLNLANVSPYQVLLALGDWKAINHTLKVLRGKVRSKAYRTHDLATLKNAARVIEGYQPLLTCYQDWVDYWKTLQANGKHINFGGDDIQGTVADSHSLRNVVSIINAADKNGLLAMGEKKKGGPSKVEMTYLVQRLVFLIRGPKTTGQSRRPFYWGAITSLILAAFPEWLGKKTDPDPDKIVRNVKNAFKRKVYNKLLIARTPAGLLLWGTPKHYNPG